jgi:hypothetical protein
MKKELHARAVRVLRVLEVDKEIIWTTRRLP